MGRRKESWAHTSEFVASLYNTVRDSKRHPKPYMADDFNPFAPPKKQKGIEAFAHLAGVTPYQARKIAEGLKVN